MSNNMDAELVCQLKKGNREAFDRIYEKYHQALYRNIFKITKSSEATEDILQDVFVTLWEKRKQLDENKTVAGWLFVISFNKSVNHTKKELKKNNLRSHLEVAYSQRQDDIDNKEIYEQQYDLLQNAIAQLSPQKQKIFILCKMEGKTYEEAAKALNISKHTVKEYLSAAMSLVKEYVRNHPEYMKIVGISAYLLLTIWLS